MAFLLRGAAAAAALRSSAAAAGLAASRRSAAAGLVTARPAAVAGVSLTARSSPLGAAAAAAAPARGYQTTPRWVKKRVAKANASATRALLKFAARFDPQRTAKLALRQTMTKLGWDFNRNEMISDGLFVDFAMKEQYCAVELVDSRHFVEPGAPNASTVPAMPEVAANASGGFLQLPGQTGFKLAPPPWANPVAGLVLDQETAARHATIRSKGWALIPVPRPLWEVAMAAPKDARYVRRDLLLSLVIPRAPFEARPVALQSTVTTDTKQKAAAAAAADKAKRDAYEAEKEAKRMQERADRRKLRREKVAAREAAAGAGAAPAAAAAAAEA